MYLHFPTKFYSKQCTFTKIILLKPAIKKFKTIIELIRTGIHIATVLKSKIKSTNIRIILFAHTLYKLKDVLCNSASLKLYNIRSLS